MTWPSLADIPAWLLNTYAFVIGLVVGSFLNVCIHRLPREQSIVKPRSACPHCQNGIGWYDNIPLLSWIFLLGRCRSCKSRISPQYFLVELLTGVLSLLAFLKFGPQLSYVLYFFLLICPLIVMTFIDLEYMIIPDILSLTGIGTGMATTLLLTRGSLSNAFLESLLGALIGGGALFSVSWLYLKLRKQEGIGGGDIKLAAMFGAFFGWKATFVILLLSSLLGSLIGVTLMILFRKGLKFAVPYGPFLAASAVLYLFYGPEIVSWYLDLVFRH